MPHYFIGNWVIFWQLLMKAGQETGDKTNSPKIVGIKMTLFLLCNIRMR